MKSSIIRLSLILGIFVLVGAGCISFKSSDTDGVYGMLKSIDGGEKWAQIVAYPTPDGVGSLSSLEINELVLDPSDKYALYIGTIADGLFYSYDGGEGWMRVKEPYLREGRIRAVAIDPDDKCTVYASRGQRIAKSEDCARTFNTEAYVDPRGDVVITDVEVDWFNSDVIYVSNTAGEVLKSVDAGVTWSTIYRRGGFIRDILIDNADSRILLLATAKAGIHRSTDGGTTWDVVLDEDMEEFERKDGVDNIRDLSSTAQSDAVWASSNYGLFRSNDHGATWIEIPLITPPEGADITAIAVDPQNGNHVVYVAGSTFYITENGGARWDTEKMPLAGRAYQLQIDPDSPATIYMGMRPVAEDGTMF